MSLRLILSSIFVCAWTQFAGAALTPISDSPDKHNEPNLIGVNPFPDNPNPSVLETLYGEANLFRVDDLLDVAFRHTGESANVKAVARFNNPTLEDVLRYYRGDGTTETVLRFNRVPPNFDFPVGYNPPSQNAFPILLAESGLVFQIGLSSRTRSHPAWNRDGQDQMVTFEIIGNAGHPENAIGNYVIGWDAFAGDDRDYQDLVYEISGAVPVPEPATSALLLSAAAAAIQFRRRARA